MLLLKWRLWEVYRSRWQALPTEIPALKREQLISGFIVIKGRERLRKTKLLYSRKGTVQCLKFRNFGILQKRNWGFVGFNCRRRNKTKHKKTLLHNPYSIAQKVILFAKRSGGESRCRGGGRRETGFLT